VSFRFRRNWSGLTAGLRRLSGSDIQTVGPAECKGVTTEGAAMDVWNSQLTNIIENSMTVTPVLVLCCSMHLHYDIIFTSCVTDIWQDLGLRQFWYENGVWFEPSFSLVSNLFQMLTQIWHTYSLW